MAVIYAQPDTRFAALGAGLGNIGAGLSAQMSMKALQAALANPGDPQAMQKAVAAASMNPIAAKALQLYLQSQQIQSTEALRRSQVAKNEFETTGPGGQAKLSEEKARAAAAESTSSLNKVKEQNAPLELATKVAGVQAAGQRAAAEQSRANTAAEALQFNKDQTAKAQAFFNDVSTTAAKVDNPPPMEKQPPRIASKLVDPQGKLDVNNDTLSHAISQNDNLWELRSKMGMRDHISFNKGGLDQVIVNPKPPDPLTEKTLGAVDGMQSTLTILQEELSKNKNNLKLGPIKGRISRLQLAFASDLRDQGILSQAQFQAAAKHQQITTETMIPGARPGVYLLNAMTDVLVAPEKSWAQNVAALKNSARVVRAQFEGLVQSSVAGRRALNPEYIKRLKAQSDDLVTPVKGIDDTLPSSVKSTTQSTKPSVPRPAGMSDDDARNYAKSAIAEGRNREDILSRLQAWGVDTSGL